MRIYTKAERQQHIEEWKKGTLSKTAYAKSAGIMPTTFYNWTRGSDNEHQGFVEIRQGKICDNTHGITIEKGNVTIRVPLTSGIRELQTIFNALGGIQ